MYEEQRVENAAYLKVKDIMAFDFFGYKKGQRFSTQITKNLEALREGYKPTVILKTLQKCYDSIQSSLINNNITEEFARINYVFAVIQNNIGQIDRREKQIEKLEAQRKLREDEYMKTAEIIEAIDNKVHAKTANDLSSFLEDD